MRNLLIAAGMLLVCMTRSQAQDLDNLNIQLHGYATQGFLYSDNNNWNTTDSSSGSAAWTEAVLNVSVQPDPRLRIGVQGRYFLLGNFGNSITLDWAQADYKVNDRFGFRAGKVKTPIGLFNDSQDIDPAHLWVLLPQATYPIASRNSLLAHYGAVAYGTVPIGEALGKVEYRAFGGERNLAGDDGFFQQFHDNGATLPNGMTGPTFGGSLHWLAPLQGLMFGASEGAGGLSGVLNEGSSAGTLTNKQARQTFYFSKYEGKKLMLAGEYSRLLLLSDTSITGLPDTTFRTDDRAWYVMGSYRIFSRLAGGAYYNSAVNRALPYVSANYQKDIVLSGRYDFSPYLYLKLEQHFMNGTALGFFKVDNLNLQPKTDMTLVKLGVSF